MYKINLLKHIKNKQVIYKLVVQNNKQGLKNGSIVDNIGLYIIQNKRPKIIIKTTKLFFWLNKGAVPNNTVFNLLFIKNNLQSFIKKNVF